jgi:hypothetical protein
MKPEQDMSLRPVDRRRRDLIRAATLTLLGGLSSACSRVVMSEPADLPDWLTGVINDPGAAADLGRAYLAETPDEQRFEQLLARIVDALVPRLGVPPASVAPAQVADTLRAVVRDEFAQAQVVNVDGWLLSVTEARLYAAVALH